MTTAPARPPLSMLQVLVCGAAIVTISMGIRHGFGLALAAGFAACRRPALMVDLANQLWNCF